MDSLVIFKNREDIKAVGVFLETEQLGEILSHGKEILIGNMILAQYDLEKIIEKMKEVEEHGIPDPQ